ncbi:hypothetical protein, partial [Rhodoblastus sphagnicola]|uniref:hypothetical protein n=1 Tax=Rhodoblastus sphagnicola TaxID=333368 RepID=UPI0019D4E4AA
SRFSISAASIIWVNPSNMLQIQTKAPNAQRLCDVCGSQIEESPDGGRVAYVGLKTFEKFR